MIRLRQAFVFVAVVAAPFSHAAAQVVAPRPAAPSLTRPVSPTKATDADGFVLRWLLLEPIKVSGQLTDSAVEATVNAEYFPDQLTVLPRDGDTVTVRGETYSWHAVDTRAYNVNLYHFAYALGKPTSNVLFWAVTVIDAPRELTRVRLAVGSNAASVWWVNGEKVVSLYNDRQTVIDDGVSKRLTLKKGSNVIRGAIINAGGATDFCARFLDSTDRPLKGITASLPPQRKSSRGYGETPQPACCDLQSLDACARAGNRRAACWIISQYAMRENAAARITRGAHHANPDGATRRLRQTSNKAQSRPRQGSSEPARRSRSTRARTTA